MAHFAGTRKLAFAIRTSKIQGKGAFATRRIKKGARIIEYLGECIDEDEADIRYPDDEMGRHHTFLFSIGDGSRVLDAGPLDWPAKYINHSCAPNCEAIEEEDGRVFISALKNIDVGMELLYDYAYERTPEHTEADEKMYACRCGAPTCRGTIMAAPKVKKGKKGKKEKGKKGKKKDKEKKMKVDVEAAKDAASSRVTSTQQGAEVRRKPSADMATDLPAAHAAKHVEKRASGSTVTKGPRTAVKKASGARRKNGATKGGTTRTRSRRGGSKTGSTTGSKVGGNTWTRVKKGKKASA